MTFQLTVFVIVVFSFFFFSTMKLHFEEIKGTLSGALCVGGSKVTSYFGASPLRPGCMLLDVFTQEEFPSINTTYSLTQKQPLKIKFLEKLKKNKSISCAL